MQHFRYTAVDRNGGQVSAAELADSESELVRRLRSKGLSPISIERVSGGTRGAISSGIRKADLVDILRGLGTLFASHVPIDRALGLLAQTTDREAVVQLLTMLRESVSRGESLAGSMAQRSDVFPNLVISMIRAGEEAGILEHLVPQLADFMDEREQTRKQVVSALIYPAFLLAVGVISVALLIGFVVPSFADLFSQMKEGIPASAAFLLAMSDWIRHWGWTLLVALPALPLGWRLVNRMPEMKIKRDRWLLHSPLFGTLVLYQDSALFCRTLSALLAAGVPLIQGLVISRGVLSNEVLQQGVIAAEEKVRAGSSLGRALEAHTEFPTLLSRLLAVGEESGRTQGVLNQLALRYDRRLKERLARLVSLIEPVLILVLGVVVGGIVMTMLSAVFSINDMGA